MGRMADGLDFNAFEGGVGAAVEDARWIRFIERALHERQTVRLPSTTNLVVMHSTSPRRGRTWNHV